MKSFITEFIDNIISLIPWVIVAWILFSWVSLATAQEQPLTEEQEIVAITLLGEAQGEKAQGLYAVGCVIQRRSEERKLTLSQVCLENKLNKNGVRVWQFSCWKDKPYIQTIRRLLKANTKQSAYAKHLARCMSKGWKLVQDFTGHANHFYSSKILKKPPFWAFDKKRREWRKPSKIIGNHVFYKL